MLIMQWCVLRYKEEWVQIGFWKIGNRLENVPYPLLKLEYVYSWGGIMIELDGQIIGK